MLCGARLLLPQGNTNRATFPVNVWPKTSFVNRQTGRLELSAKSNIFLRKRQATFLPA